MTTQHINHMKNRLEDIETNPHLITFYAKRNCKWCHGRGHQTISTRNKDTNVWTKNTAMCPCVIKAVRKEIKELEQEDG